MSSPEPEPKAPSGSNRLLGWLASHTAMIVGAVIVAIAAGIIGYQLNNNSTSSADPGRCPSTTVAADVSPTVVTLQVTSATGQGSNGSGEVIRSDGYILTNDHVISSALNGGTVTVLFSDGQTAPATITGTTSAVDLAVVKVNEPQTLPTISYGSSASLQVGEPVVAIGAPLGLSGTVTSGIVSALGRDIPVPSSSGQNALLPGAVQTDASINPGNSGGALVDCDGKLVGVNTAISTVPSASGQGGGGSVGIGFAVPVDLAKEVADQLIATGKFTLPDFGATTIPIPPSAAQTFGVSGGLYVVSVTAGGPAANAGLRAGDVITSIDGRDTADQEGLFLSLVTKAPGDQVTVQYVRSGTTDKTSVTLAQQQ
ncbi:MAG: putative serine protease PepD [Frankiales bacterium]|nr:putative serine protease PepD [Frankiales bacterium]